MHRRESRRPAAGGVSVAGGVPWQRAALAPGPLPVAGDHPAAGIME